MSILMSVCGRLDVPHVNCTNQRSWFVCSWGGRYTHFCAVYQTSFQRRMAKSGREKGSGQDELKMCPLAHDFDLQIHDAIANLRRLDGNIPPHKDHGRSVDFFTEKGKRKFWVKSSTPIFGYMFFYTLDKVVAPFLAEAFGQPIWHPRTLQELDTLLAAKVPV